MTLYYLPHHRSEDQLSQMRRLEAEGVCLFCPAHLAARGGHVLYRTPHWTITSNAFPYQGTKLHCLLVPDEHVTDLADLSAPAQVDFWAALAWLREHFGLAYYGLAARNGDCERTGGTIRHVHVHVIQGDVEDPDHEPVRFRLSARP